MPPRRGTRASTRGPSTVGGPVAVPVESPTPSEEPAGLGGAAVVGTMTPGPAKYSTSYGSPLTLVPQRQNIGGQAGNLAGALGSVLASVNKDNRRDAKKRAEREAEEARRRNELDETRWRNEADEARRKSDHEKARQREEERAARHEREQASRKQDEEKASAEVTLAQSRPTRELISIPSKFEHVLTHPRAGRESNFSATIHGAAGEAQLTGSGCRHPKHGTQTAFRAAKCHYAEPELLRGEPSFWRCYCYDSASAVCRAVGINTIDHPCSQESLRWNAVAFETTAHTVSSRREYAGSQARSHNNRRGRR